MKALARLAIAGIIAAAPVVVACSFDFDGYTSVPQSFVGADADAAAPLPTGQPDASPETPDTNPAPTATMTATSVPEAAPPACTATPATCTSAEQACGTKCVNDATNCTNMCGLLSGANCRPMCNDAYTACANKCIATCSSCASASMCPASACTRDGG